MIAYTVRILRKDEAERFVNFIGVEAGAVPLLAPKAIYKNILLRSVKTSWANIIKQEMLASGGDAAISNKSYNCSRSHTDALLMGSDSCFSRFLKKMRMQPECFDVLTTELERIINNGPMVIRIAGRTYDLNKENIIFGILNITPDSFSDGGKYLNVDLAFKRAEEMLEQGANFIDVGGESTRSGSERIPLQEEKDRVMPVIEAITKRFGSVVSVDSYKPELLKDALRAGVKVVNDISNGSAVSSVVKEIIDNDAAAIVMMNRSTNDVSGSVVGQSGQDPVLEFMDFCYQKRDVFAKSGLGSDRLIFDPGIGFGLSDNDVNILFKNASSFATSGFATCWGISRKSFIGRTLQVDVSNRDHISNSISLYLLTQGVKIFRTHSVDGLNTVLNFYKGVEGA